MANNLIANQLNCKIALTTKTWAQLGFNGATISVVYLLDPVGGRPLITWKPGDPFSQLTGIARDSSYLIQPKVNLDLSLDFAAPIPQFTTTTSTTTSTTTIFVPNPFRYATAQDAVDIFNANINDYLLTGPNITSGENSITIQPSFGNTFTLENCTKKILIKGGTYDKIIIDNPPVSGTSGCPIIITNYDGQVNCKTLIIRGMSYWKLTGKYDTSAQTGDVNFQGHLGPSGYLFSAGKYGIQADNQWSNLGWALLAVSNSYDGITQASNWEIEFTEARGGGFSNLFKSDNFAVTMDGVSIHDNYWHDIQSEGIYLGSTGGDPQNLFTNLHVYNNRILRVGNDGVQFGQLSSNCIIERNVIFGAINWRSPFGEFQDNSIQFLVRNGNVAFRNNLVLGGSGINFFVNSLPAGQGTPTGVIDMSGNVFLNIRSGLCGYFGQSNPLNVPIRFSNNYIGKNQFLYPEVYTDTRAINSTHVVRIANNNQIELRNNVWDGSDGKTTFYAIQGGSIPTIDAANNSNRAIPNPEFIDFMRFPPNFNYLGLEQWASKVGDTLGDETSFGYQGTLKGQPVIYSVGDYVVWKSKMYVSLQSNNSQIEPGISSGWESWWELVTFTTPDSTQTTFFPDDVRLTSTSLYNYINAGLIDNPTYNGTTTTTTSSTTTTTTTAASLANKLTLSVTDNGATFNLKWGTPKTALLESPLFIGIGSSTLAGTGASSFSKSLPQKIQDGLSTVANGFPVFANNALSGTATTSALPTGTGPDINENRNITMAVAAKPTAIIIAFPSNDIINGLTPGQFRDNIQLMYNLCRSNNIPAFVISPQPRTDASYAQQQGISTSYNLIKNAIPTEAFVDVFNLLRDSNSPNPCDIDPTYNADGIHVNDAGHQLIFDQLWSKVNQFFTDPTFLSYTIQTGTTTGLGNIPAIWDTFDNITDNTILSRNYPRLNGNWNVYRIVGTKNDSSLTIPSDPIWIKQTNQAGNIIETIQIDFSLDSVAPPPADWNNFVATNTGPTLNQSLELINSDQIATSVVATVTKIFNGASTGGSTSGIYPLAVTSDSWYMANSKVERAQIVISGLDTAYIYNLDIFSSRVNSGGDRVLSVNVVDSTNLIKSGSLNSDSALGVANNSRLINLNSVYPDNSGNITIDIYTAGSISYINSLVIKKLSNSAIITTTSTTTTSTTLTPGDKTINVNVYNGTNPSNDSAWNDWNVGTPSSLQGFTNFKFANGTNSNISATIAGFDGVIDNGDSYGGSIVPPSVLRTGIYTTAGPGFTGNLINIVLTGLNNSTFYTFEFVGSRSSSGNATFYQAIGTTTVTSSALNTDSNKTGSVFINSILPSSGTITLKIRKNSGTFAYLNAFRVILGTLVTTTTTTTTSSTTTTTTTGTGTTTTTTSTTSGPTTTTTTTSTTSTSSTTTTSTTAIPGTSTYTVKGPYFGSSQAWVYTPAGYTTSSDNYPLILFFHGAGQVGTNINNVNTDALAQLINNGQSMRCLVICPQLASGSWTTSGMKAAYDYMVFNYRVDVNRVYATGLSLGSTGASDFVAAYPQLLAAYAVSSGTYNTTSGALNAKKNLPAWYHHGDVDTTQNTGNTQNVINALNALNPRPKFPPLVSIYQGLGHSSAVWNDHFYNKSIAKYNFESWLLLHNLDAITTATNYIAKAENTFEIHDYSYASRLVNLLPDSATKDTLISRLAALKISIDGTNRRFVIDFGTLTTGGYVNNITSGVTGTTLSNLVDENGSTSTFGFTIVSQAAPSGSTEATSPGLSNEYFGFNQNMYGDTFMAYFNGGTYKLTGLNNSMRYKLRIYPSKDTIAPVQPNMPSVAIGTTVKYIYANYNTTEWIEFDNLIPSGGEISFNFKSAPILNGGVTPSVDPSGANVVTTSQISGYRGWNVYLVGLTLLEKPNVSPTTTTSTSSTSSSTTSSSTSTTTSTTSSTTTSTTTIAPTTTTTSTTSSTTTSTTTIATTTTTTSTTSTSSTTTTSTTIATTTTSTTSSTTTSTTTVVTTTTSTTSTTSSTSSTTTTSTTFAPTVAKFNFAKDGTGAGTPSGWIPVYGDPLSSRIQVVDTGQNGATNTGIGIDTVATGSPYWVGAGSPLSCSSNTQGTSTGTNTGYMPDNVMISYFFNFYASAYTGGNENMYITGLVTGATYKIEVLGSRDRTSTPGSFSGSRFCTVACVEASGTEKIDNYDIASNTSTALTFTSKTPVSNIIKMAFYRNTGLGANDIAGYVNGMIVTRLT